MLIEINNQTKKKINSSSIKKIVKLFLCFYHLDNKEVSLAFVGDQVSKKINKTYRGLDKATDVLAFSKINADNDNFLGEIIINCEQIKRQAKQFNHSTQQELIFILVHGLLHLIGYNDETEEEKENMIRLGEEFIKLKCKESII